MTPATVRRPRPRDLGLITGTMSPGDLNAITDVDGVLVGHTTLIEGDGPLIQGEGPVRTGVTIVRPHPGNLFREKVPGAMFFFNGHGRCFGQEQVDEFGNIDSPVALCGSTHVGRVADALVTHGIACAPESGTSAASINPVVGECSDRFLSDTRGRHVDQTHVLDAIDRAKGGPVEEGNVGAGTGTGLYEFKGGIGTSSRRLSEEQGGYTVGVLVQTNFGRREDLTISGVPIGRLLTDPPGDPSDETTGDSSCMIVLATDAPMLDRSLRRLARRTILGLGRTGTFGGNGSGDVAIAFSTGLRIPLETSDHEIPLSHVSETMWSSTIAGLIQAAVEATEEAVLNSLFVARTMVGRDGNTRHELPVDRVLTLLDSANRLSP